MKCDNLEELRTLISLFGDDIYLIEIYGEEEVSCKIKNCDLEDYLMDKEEFGMDAIGIIVEINFMGVQKIILRNAWHYETKKWIDLIFVPSNFIEHHLETEIEKKERDIFELKNKIKEIKRSTKWKFKK